MQQQPFKRSFFSAEMLSSLGVAILTLSLFLARFGYDYGISDQEEFVPAAIHAANADAFANDWFVTTQAEYTNVRTPTVFIVRTVNRILSMQTTLALLFTITFTLLSVSIYHIARAFDTNRYLALACTVGTLVLTPQWTIGGNDLAQHVLTPSMMAWSLALAGVALSLNRQYLISAILLGLSMYLQPLVSVQVAFILLSARFVASWMDKTLTWREFGSIILQGLLYSAIAAPFAYLILTGDNTTAEPAMLFDTLANVRAPHHYLFSSFPVRNIVLFIGLLCVGIVCAILYKGPHRSDMLVVLGLVLALCITGYVLTELSPALPVLKLQLFKSSVLAKLFSIVATVALFSSNPLLQTSKSNEQIVNRFFLICTISGIIIVSLLAFATPASLLPGRARMIDGMSSLERWVIQETPPGAVFMIPPSNSRFRIRTERAIVVNFKAFPFQRQEMINWRTRLEDVSGEILRVRNTGERLASLDYFYESKESSELTELSDRYGADFIVRRSPIERAADAFELKFLSHDGWRVYEVRR